MIGRKRDGERAEVRADSGMAWAFETLARFTAAEKQTWYARILRMAGSTDAEIAEAARCSVATVRRDARRPMPDLHPIPGDVHDAG